MQEFDEGREQVKKAVLLVGVQRLGPADEAIKAELDKINDLERLDRMLYHAVTAASWQEILDTPWDPGATEETRRLL